MMHDTQLSALFLCPFVPQAICGYGAQDTLPFRPTKEGELFFVEDRDINLVELALATNIPKGCAETMVRGMAHHTALLRNRPLSLGLSSFYIKGKFFFNLYSF